MAIFKTLTDYLTRIFTLNYSKSYQSSDNEYVIKFALDKNNKKINLDCIIPNIEKTNVVETANNFLGLLKYVAGETVLNDVMLTFSENVEQESDEYKKFVRHILSELSKEYLSNKEIEQPAQSKYESPLVRPIYAIKNIVTSEII
jgi:pyruvate-formate lyase